MSRYLQLILFQRGATSWGFQIGPFCMYWPFASFWRAGCRPQFVVERHDSDAILGEIERRLIEHFDTPGYSEHNSGYADVLKWIEELRGTGR